MTKRFLLLAMLLGLAGCSALAAPLTPQQAATLQTLEQDRAQAQADLRTIHAQLPANDLVGKGAGKADDALGKAAPVTGGAANAAAQPGATLGDVVGGVIAGAVPLIPQPYASYVGLAAILYGLIKNRQATTAKDNAAKSDAAATSMQSGVTAALANGSLVATPKAAGTIDAMIVDHPTANALVTAVENSVAVNALKG